MFLKNCAQDVKAALIEHSIGLVYTPTNEHFGIVPLEGMALGRPVIAHNSGGPMETVIPKVNGFLCNNWEEFGEAMRELVEHPELVEKFMQLRRKYMREVNVAPSINDERPFGSHNT